MEKEIEELKKKVEMLENNFKSLGSSTTIPLPVDKAFRDRLKDVFSITISSKSADSEDQAVNEAGAGSYSVLGDPDGFLQIPIGGSVYYIPYFD